MSQGRDDAGALVYARALLDTLIADSEAPEALREAGDAMGAVAEAWTSKRALRGYFETSHVAAPQKTAAMEKWAGSDVPPIVGNFMRLLLRRGRLSLLPQINGAFQGLLDERLNRIQVTLTTAVPVDEVSLRSWTDKIRAIVGGEPILTHRVDPNILAGAVIRVGDQVADGSAASRLKRLEAAIVEKGRQHALQS